MYVVGYASLEHRTSKLQGESPPFPCRHWSIKFVVGWHFFEPAYLPLFLHYICVSVLRWRTTDLDYFIFGLVHVRFRWHAFRGGSRPATTLPSP